MNHEIPKAINEILSRNGLENLIHFDDKASLAAEPLASCQRYLDIDDAHLNIVGLHYKFPANEDDLSISFVVQGIGVPKENLKAVSSKVTSLLDVSREEYVLALNVRSHTVVKMVVDEHGKLKKVAEYFQKTLMGEVFAGINAEKGADFAPLFEKMIQLYKQHYAPDKKPELSTDKK